MSDVVKSAWELALEKLQQQDRARGESAPGPLSTAKKKAIAVVRAKYQARLAEAEILHNDQRRKVLEDADALAKVEEQYQIDRRRIEEQRDAAVERARRGQAAPAGKAGRARKKRS